MFSILASKSKAPKNACSFHPKHVVLDKLLHGYVQELKSSVCLLLVQEISQLSHKDGPCHEDNSCNSKEWEILQHQLMYSMLMSVCGVCLYICMPLYLCLCIYMYVCLCMFRWVLLCICMCVFMNIQMGICVSIGMFVCMYACVSCKSRYDSYTIRTEFQPRISIKFFKLLPEPLRILSQQIKKYLKAFGNGNRHRQGFAAQLF